MKKIIIIISLLLLPITVCAKEELIPNATTGILIDADSGKVLYSKDKDNKVSVASMTKMVAQIIILEEVEKGKIKWTDIVTVSKNASDMGGSQIYLETNEKMSVLDLMKGVSVASANDATVALAEYISGSEEKFVKKMNKKVLELGLKNTHFSNSTGLDEDNHYSTSSDMAKIARDLVINHPKILEFSSIYEDYLRQDQEEKFWLVNTNKLVKLYPGVDGLKTGHTDDAGYCMTVTAKKNGLRVIGVVTGEKSAKERNKEEINLLDYAFSNYKVKTIVSKSKDLGSIKVLKGKKDKVPIVLQEDATIIEDSEKNTKYKYNINIDEILEAPITKNQIIGSLEVILKNKVVKKVNIITKEEIVKANLLDLYKKTIAKVLTGK